MVTQADGFAEREAAKVMIRDAGQATASADTEVTLGADKGYDAAELIETLHRMKVTPHVGRDIAAVIPPLGRTRTDAHPNARP